MDEFFEKMETGIAEFEEKILAHYLNEEKKSALSTAKSHTDWALSYFESHRNAQALEYRDQVKREGGRRSFLNLKEFKEFKFIVFFLVFLLFFILTGFGRFRRHRSQ